MVSDKLKNKGISAPIFYPSVSSVSKNVWSIIDHVELLVSIDYPQFLVSCFDIYWNQNDQRIFLALNKAKEQCQAILWDSGIYEVVWSRSNKWSKKQYVETLKKHSFFQAFSFDDYCLKKEDQDPSAIALSVLEDIKEVGKSSISPIIHCQNPEKYPTTCYNITRICEPKLIAIPERELGDGVLEIVMNIRKIRSELNKLDKYQPLHILGTGNPISMMLYTFSGADSFDGLDWCQTVVDFESGTLHHPLHLDLYKHQSHWGSDNDISFFSRCYLHNLEFYKSWELSLQSALLNNQAERMIQKYLSPFFFDQVAPVIFGTDKIARC